MSRLFREMQAAAAGAAGEPINSAVLTDLLNGVGDDAVAVQQAAAGPLETCRHVELPHLHRPLLQPSDEAPSTHTAAEAYRSLRTKLTRFQATQGVRSVIISSAVAGEGKTVSALNLAMSLAQLENQRVLLIDGDIRTGGLSRLAGTLQSAGLTEVLTGQLAFEAALTATNLPRLYMVSAGEANTAVASDLFAGPRWKEFISWCNQMFDMVVVDCPPILGLADFDLMSGACDGVLLVVRAKKTKRETLTEVAQHVQSKKVLGLILNGQEKQHRNRYSYYYYSRAKGAGN